MDLLACERGRGLLFLGRWLPGGGRPCLLGRWPCGLQRLDPGTQFRIFLACLLRHQAHRIEFVAAHEVALRQPAIHPALHGGFGFRLRSLSDAHRVRHNLAEVSKQFTSAGIMLLQQQGELNYDDPVANYIDDYPYKGVTIRNLMTMTSGVPDAYMDLALEKEQEIPLLTNEIAVDLIIEAYQEPYAAPNDQYKYSNTNYITLARIIEILSGSSFEDFMKTELFEPLGMENTRVWNLLSEESTFVNKADDFKNDNGNTSKLEPTFIDGVAGDGAVFSSVMDLLIWDQSLYSHAELSKENLEEAFSKALIDGF